MNDGHGSAEFGEGSGVPGVRGQWTKSREDGGGGGVLERGREGAARKGEWDGGRWLLTALGRAAEGKRGRQGGPVGDSAGSVATADSGPAAARSVSGRSRWCRVTDAQDPTDSGRGREEREIRGTRGPT
jgi:hypothetical protein